MSSSKLKKDNLSQEDLLNFSELFKLMKPRVMSLVIFTCAVGLLTAPTIVSTQDAIIGILLVSMGAGAAGALNMWYESDLDALMSRTCLRPIPTGKIKKNQALYFGIVLSFVSITMLYYSANLISAILLASTIAFYFFIYTIWLKRKTSQNIVIGATGTVKGDIEFGNNLRTENGADIDGYIKKTNTSKSKLTGDFLFKKKDKKEAPDTEDRPDVVNKEAIA